VRPCARPKLGHASLPFGCVRVHDLPNRSSRYVSTALALDASAALLSLIVAVSADWWGVCPIDGASGCRSPCRRPCHPLAVGRRRGRAGCRGAHLLVLGPAHGVGQTTDFPSLRLTQWGRAPGVGARTDFGAVPPTARDPHCHSQPHIASDNTSCPPNHHRSLSEKSRHPPHTRLPNRIPFIA